MPRLLLIALLALTCFSPIVRAGQLALVLSDDSPPYQEFAQALERALAGSQWQIAPHRSKDQRIDTRSELIVTAGSDALRQTLVNRPQQPVLATLLPRTSYESLLAESGHKSPISAIYLDQPPERQAGFIRLLLPGSRQVGLLTSELTRQQGSSFRQALGRRGLTLQQESINSDAGLIAAVETLLPRVDLLLAIPDSRLYTRQSLKPLLITAYRHRRPIVAFSAAFVKAGALASLYATPEQMARQTADTLLQHGRQLPPPSSARFFSVSINSSVADAFDLSIPDETTLLRALNEEAGR